MSGSERGRTAWAVPLLLFAGVLLAAGLAYNLANLDTRGDEVPGVPGRGGTEVSPEGTLVLGPILDAVLGVLAAVLIVSGAYLGVRYARRARIAPVRIVSTRNYLSTIFSLLLFALFVLLWPLVPRLVAPPSGGGSDPNPGGGFGIDLPGIGSAAVGTVLAGLLLGGVVMAALLMSGAARRPALARGSSRPDLEPEAAAAVDQAIADLEAGGDVRSAILACFHRFCLLLRAKGVKAQATLTPRELEAAAVRRLGVPRKEVEDLTVLFEVARYSDHPLGEPDRQRAVRSLSALRSVLEA